MAAIADRVGAMNVAMQHEYVNQLEILIQLGLQPGSSLVAVPSGSR